MNYILLGLNHKSAPLEIREKLCFSLSHLEDALLLLESYPFIDECVILSTCNRVELYAQADHVELGLTSLREFLSKYHEIKFDIDSYFYHYSGCQVVEHLFKVSSSLDSMVVGENQILGQVKQAYTVALKAGTARKFLSFLFQHALHVGKRVRAETAISQGAISISSVAVELAKTVFNNDLKDKKILIIGAGKVGELTAQVLRRRGINFIFVANRTYEKAVELAKRFKGQAIRFDRLQDAILDSDIVISSTSAPHLIIKKETLLPLMQKRSNRKIVFIDLGVPRNVEKDISKITGVYLYNIDDLKRISEKNLRQRINEARLAEKIVKEETQLFIKRLGNYQLQYHKISIEA